MARPWILMPKNGRNGTRVLDDEVIRPCSDDFPISFKEIVRDQMLMAVHDVIGGPQASDACEDWSRILCERMERRKTVDDDG
jgi:serine/threonine protein phosphatase PrpC